MNTIKHMKKMPLLIGGFLLVVLLLVVSIFSVTKNKNELNSTKTNTTQTNPNITPIPMRLSFDKANIQLKNQTENKITSDIKLDVGAMDIRSTKIVILCDPKRVKNLTLTQKRDRYSALSYAFANSKAVVNQDTCEGTLTLEIPKENPEQRGSGIVAELKATVTGNAPTEIVILPQSVGTTDNPTQQFQTQRVNLELTP